MSPRTSVDALWVAALVSEVAPLVGLLERPRLLSHRLCVGRVGDRRVAVLRCGVGPERAERRTREALARLEAFGSAPAAFDAQAERACAVEAAVAAARAEGGALAILDVVAPGLREALPLNEALPD